jgi:D-3-phosphoglycerate dehydrogenase
VAIVDERGSAFGTRVLEVMADAGCEVVTSRAVAEDDVIEVVRDADGIIYNAPVSRRFMEALTRCRVLVRPSVGMDIVAGVDLATAKGIVVCNTPGVIEEEVADHTVALLLSVTRCMRPLEQHVRSGAWHRREPAPALSPIRLSGATLGLVGFGRIGRGVAQRALGFGMQVLAHDPFVPADAVALHGARSVTLAEVLQDSDVVSLHLPWSPATDKLIGERELLMMRRNAILLNTSRGSIVDEEALVAVLASGRIAGAGLDVMEREPIAADHPLCALANVALTPHWGSRGVWADEERYVRAAQQVIAVLAGMRPYAVWNPEVLARLALR